MHEDSEQQVTNLVRHGVAKRQTGCDLLAGGHRQDPMVRDGGEPGQS
jgi:hypothetical protein